MTDHISHWFFNSLFCAGMDPFCVKIQAIQLELSATSPSRGLVHWLHPYIESRLLSFFPTYKAHHSKAWSQCPCIRLATVTPWHPPWISSNVSLYFPLFSVSPLTPRPVVLKTAPALSRYFCFDASQPSTGVCLAILQMALFGRNLSWLVAPP